MENAEYRIEEIRKITLIGAFVNIFLSLLKILAGIFGKSTAIIADGIHSLSDLSTDIIVFIFIKISGKDRDYNHKYGHGKFETFAAMLVSFALAVVALGIFWAGVKKVINLINGIVIEKPDIIALYAAILSIISKEVLFRITRRVGIKYNSQSVVANAWHHRSDAFSSIGTSLGISGAIFLGDKWRILDPLASIIVCFFIMKVAIDIGMLSIKELLETSLPEETEREIIDIIKKTSGVKDFHNLKTRKIGNVVGIDVHIKVDKDLNVENSHKIATEIENSLKNKYGISSHIGIHIEPYKDKKLEK